MITRQHISLLALAVCLVLPAVCGAKHSVTRPNNIHATATWIVSLADGSAVVQQIGETEHLGRFISEGIGQWDLENFTFVSASGTATAVNGDQVFWEMPGSDYQIQYTGGTGRGANMTGGFDTVWQSEPEIMGGPEPGTIAITISYRGESTVTY